MTSAAAEICRTALWRNRCYATIDKHPSAEQYVLLLVLGPQGILWIIFPKGRYKIDAKGRLSSAAHSSVADRAKANDLPAFAG
jgi:hypothetical protein